MLHDDARSDVNALLPGRATEAGATRRTALQVAMGLGYAAAAAPLMAQTAIATPADGLDAGEVSFTVGGFQVPAYRAAPVGKTGLPVVLVDERHSSLLAEDLLRESGRRGRKQKPVLDQVAAQVILQSFFDQGGEAFDPTRPMAEGKDD